MSYGLCQCGCGHQTRIAPVTDRAKGWVKGRPLNFIKGHNTAFVGKAKTKQALGNRTISSHGYVLVLTGCRQRKYEHILVAERAIGRPLRKFGRGNPRTEVVHHINGIKTDNRSENLLVCTHGPFLLAGFETANKEAAGKAREAKASWRTLTGETYGSVKAEGWAAVSDAPAAGALAAAEKEVETLDAAIEAAIAAASEMQTKTKASSGRSAKIAELTEQAGRRERIEAKLKRDLAELDEWQAKVDALRASQKSQDAAPCPDCGAMLVMVDGALKHAAPMAKGTEDDLAKLPQYEKALTLMKSAVENGRRDLQAVEVAAETLKQLQQEAGESEISEGAILEAQSKINALKNERKGAHDRLLMIRQANVQAADAANKTAHAGKYHRDVQAWEAIADALAPGGIPSEMLAEALGPINDRLAASSSLAQWGKVEISADMAVTSAGRDYALLSESEQWRADAMLKYAGTRCAFYRWVRDGAQ